MSLPISDLDNPHNKRKVQHKPRCKTGLCIIFLVLCLFFIGYGVAGPTKYVKYWDYLPPSVANPTNSATLECTKSYDGKKPVDQYVVMIDAGSSGSRVHVYHFNNCQKMPYLVGEKFLMKDIGLSSYASDPEQAAKSLDSLLQVAVENVPKERQKCTPIAVLATAGLRKLGEEASQKILDAVTSHLEDNYPFPIIENGVSILSGDDEGVYAWVTANFLLGNIGTSAKTPTVAIFDLGGKSTQIVFEPTFKDPKETLIDGDHKFLKSFGGRDFTLYQHSYLDYGLTAAVEKINREVVKSQRGPHDVYINPCLPPGTTLTVKISVPDGSVTKDGDNLVLQDVKFVGPSEASPLQCRAIAEKVLKKNQVCVNPPCAFGGVHQPRLLDSFPMDSDLYVFSFFYDRTAPLGMPSTFNLAEFGELTSLVCRGSEAYPAFEAVDGAVDALKKNPLWCTELSYMNALLRTGYEIKGHRDVKIANKINDKELGWCLGASLPLLDATNWKCKA